MLIESHLLLVVTIFIMISLRQNKLNCITLMKIMFIVVDTLKCIYNHVYNSHDAYNINGSAVRDLLMQKFSVK